MKKVMVIAGGDWQAHLIKKIKSMGHFVICTNLYGDTSGILEANHGIVADVKDKEKNLNIAIECKPDIVITDQSDIAVPTVAYVSEKLGLPGIGIECAELFTNKGLMRIFAKEHGFACPAFTLCSTYKEAAMFVKQYHKGVIKPLNSQSSRGVFVVECEGVDFSKEFELARSFTLDSEGVLVEEYLEGEEFTVDGIKIGEEYQVLAISEKRHYEHNSTIAKELYFSHENAKVDYNKLKEINKELVLAMGLPFGMTHAEYKYHKGEFVLIEIAARGGGTQISSDIVPVMSGIDSNMLLVKYMLGEKVSIHNRVSCGECAILKFIEIPEGIVSNIEGMSEVQKMENVIDIQLKIRIGDTVKRPKDDSTRGGFYIAFGKTAKELEKVCCDVEKTLKIEMED